MRRGNPANLTRLIDEAEDAHLCGHGLVDDVESRERADRAEQRAAAEQRAVSPS